MTRHDRRELSFLGALLLAWALVFAPWVHQLVAHADQPGFGSLKSLPLKAQGGHGHSHGPARGGEHGAGSLEHGKALFTGVAAAPALLLLMVAIGSVGFDEPVAPSLSIWLSVAQAQGP